jgi:hypothetical protein
LFILATLRPVGLSLWAGVIAFMDQSCVDGVVVHARACLGWWTGAAVAAVAIVLLA